MLMMAPACARRLPDSSAGPADASRSGPSVRASAVVGEDAPHSIRRASAGDAADVTELLRELGYPDCASNVRQRLARLAPREDAGVLVGVIDGVVAAVAAYQLIELLERPEPECRITALVVAGGHRRRGLAHALVCAIECIATDHGCLALEVTTRPQRPGATRFYLAVGFQERPRRLIKLLERGDAPRTT